MNIDIIRNIKELLALDREQKDSLNKLAMQHTDWDSELRRELIHHALQQDVLPGRYDGESDFAYNTRLMATRRRLVAQTRLAGCLLKVLPGSTSRKNI